MVTEKYPSTCPNCGAEMIDDAWEKIHFLENGDIQIEPISSAWVCRAWCGFFVEIEDDFYE